jgi:hypothetical protein
MLLEEDDVEPGELSALDLAEPGSPVELLRCCLDERGVEPEQAIAKLKCAALELLEDEPAEPATLEARVHREASTSGSRWADPALASP